MDEEIQINKNSLNIKSVIIRGIITSILVGSILLSMNHFDKLLLGVFEISWLTNYLVPLVVSITSGFLANKETHKKTKKLARANHDLKIHSNDLKDTLDLNTKKFVELKELQEHNSFMSDIESSFNDLVWEYKDHENFGKKLLDFTCQKFKIAKGSLYLTISGSYLDNTKVTLEIAAQHASDNANRVTYEPGEGLVGQCYLDKKIIVLNDVPDDFIKISSGLGATVPKSVLIIPLIFNEVVTGIFELASLYKIEATQIQNIERLAKQCAAVLNSLKEEQTIKELLDESSRKTSLLKRREQELEEKLKEITTFHKELSDSEAHLRKQIDENKQQQLSNKIIQVNTFIKSFLKEGKSEVYFLSNTPPISGMRRAMNPEKFDKEGNSTFGQWVARMTSIIKSLLISKQIFSHFILIIKETQEVILQASEDSKKDIEAINFEEVQKLSGTMKTEDYEFSDKITIGKSFQAVFLREIEFDRNLTGQLFLIADIEEIEQFIRPLNNSEGCFIVTHKNTDIFTGNIIQPSEDMGQLIESETRVDYKFVGKKNILVKL